MLAAWGADNCRNRKLFGGMAVLTGLFAPAAWPAGWLVLAVGVQASYTSAPPSDARLESAPSTLT